MPGEMVDAHLLYETGWPPDVLDVQPSERINAYLFYRKVRHVREYGGTLAL